MPELLFAIPYLPFACASVSFWEPFAVSRFDPCLDMFPQVYIWFSFCDPCQILPIVAERANMAAVRGDEGAFCPVCLTVSGAESALRRCERTE